MCSGSDPREKLASMISGAWPSALTVRVSAPGSVCATMNRPSASGVVFGFGGAVHPVVAGQDHRPGDGVAGGVRHAAFHPDAASPPEESRTVA